ncbi:type I restriction endonuclease subunit R [Corynebacterium felinum]|uniref:type I restriction endonuclease subunit R n=1 Tax=Corynebacterium felinum TaxID=131318 RepID=UPI0023F88506|nr:type I restriction endonuclease subunit R [Corynebacterium felinum]MDF5820676.1 type I restriction endonuclease subunit R [Corynebacterium felinum]WJY95593.1 Type I restriction enzyme R protein [Corynebacterium felinum]
MTNASASFNENIVELAALDYFAQLGYQTVSGAFIAPGEPAAEREDYSQVILWDRLREAAARINPRVSRRQIEQAIVKLQRAESQSLIDENLRVHDLLTKGISVEKRERDGRLSYEHVWFIDFGNPDNNDWAAINQFTIIENKNRRPDVLVYVNGLPLALLELKNPVTENATLRSAWNQIQTYRRDIPSVFITNVMTVISDGTSAAMSSFSGAFEHYAPWKTIDGRDVVTNRPALEVLIKGVFNKQRFLDLFLNFTVFSEETVTDKKTKEKSLVLIKRIAKYHQYWAVNAAIESTVMAAGPDGDRRGGVVWHTQGSGKSFEMVFYAAKIMRDPRMANPTLVFITDRNDLDDQLFAEVFAPAKILPEVPVQAESREDLREKLKRRSGGIIFTTLQKFAPPLDEEKNFQLSGRSNVIVVADEAHRSQYGLKQKLDKDGKLKSGLAKHMRDVLPQATFLGFTGTPIESGDKSTRFVFGDYIDVYDLTRAVEDGATVKIFYESRLARVALSEDEYASLDMLADEITEQVEEAEASAAKSRWSRLEAIVGADERLNLVAEDIIQHWEKRKETMVGKAMIVTMSRRIAVELYNKIVALRPQWHSDDHMKGKLKVIMTGSAADPEIFQPHILNKDQQRDIKARAKDPEDELELVIVRDMWLTGFDAPSLNTMYVDKTMKGAGLMQAIARVNRKFRDKPGGLIVDYIGLFSNLQEALGEYSPSDQSQVGVPIEQLLDVMLEKYDVVRGIVHGVKFNSSPDLSPSERLGEYAKVLDYVMDDPDRTKRYLDQVLALVKVFALVGGQPQAQRISNDVRLFTDVRSALLKIQSPGSGSGGLGSVEVDTALSQLINEAVTADKVVDIYEMAGVTTPEISLLSDEFLDSLAVKEKPNLQMGLLRRLLNDEIKTISRENIVQGRKFSEQLEEAVNRYTNRSLSTAEIVAELVRLAKEVRDEYRRCEEMELSYAEVAIYDALAHHDTAVLEMGDETLKKITIDLVHAVRGSVTIDWNVKKSVQSEMRSKIKRLLAKYDYPPDQEEIAVELVIAQAELWANTVSLTE